MTTPRLQQFSSTLDSSGLAAALAVLNGGVAHRYTALYQLQGGLLRNLELHDKQNEVRPEFLLEVPLETSFCQFVLRDGLFRTSDSGGDSRLDGHPYQGVMVSYHGVPLVDSSGGVLGTLCHFDVEALDLSDTEFELLQQAAQRLPAFLGAGTSS
ncbi:MAG: GAF domain-containing protein [Polaromonas sp.]|nr:GAF domain-containing protein [Polaromonas sp.]